MDPTFANSAVNYAPLVEVGTLTAAAIACAAVTSTVLSVRARRHQRRWQSLGASLGLLPPRKRNHSLPMTPMVAGTYRGRSVEATLLPGTHGAVCITTARIANPRHLLDRVSAADSLPPWLAGKSRAALAALPGTAWKIEVRGTRLTLSAPCPDAVPGGAGDTRPLRELLDLACDLAEGIDAATGAFPTAALNASAAAPPVLRRR